MINLLPPQRLLNKQIARSNTVLRRYAQLSVISMVVIGLAVVVASYFLKSQHNDVEETVARNTQKVSELSPVHKQGEELAATITTISNLLSHNVNFSDMLTQIGGVTPPGAILTGLQFSIEDFDSPLVITARVESAERGAVLRNNLASSDLFAKAEIQSITQAGDSDTSSVPDAPTPEGDIAPKTQKQSRYKYTAVINAHFKKDVGKKK
jgi:Tfp pilus assembly protein PilN